MEQQHGHVGNTLVYGEEGDHMVAMTKSVSHHDQLSRVITESHPDKQHQTRALDNVANIQDGVKDTGSREEYIGGRDFTDKEFRKYEGGPSRSYGRSMDHFKPLGEMTAAVESLARVKMPSPPTPNIDQFPSHYRGGRDQDPQHEGHDGLTGPGSIPQYGGLSPPHTTLANLAAAYGDFIHEAVGQDGEEWKETNLGQGDVQYRNFLYGAAGCLVQEQREELTLESYSHLLSDKVHLHLLQVLEENPLSFELQDFQKLAVHVLGSGENCILISPTGSGKMLVVYIAILVLQKVYNMDGVGIGTQPLNSIMREKIKKPYIPTGLISMKGDVLHSEEEEEEVFLSDSAEDFKTGKVKCIIGHAESWRSSVAEEILARLQEQGMILLTFLDEAHISLPGHWEGFRHQLRLVPGLLRGRARRGAPCLAMTATLTPVEVTELEKTCLGTRSSVVLKANPIQEHHKYMRIERPPSIYGSYGKEVKGVQKDGLVQVLQEVCLDDYITSLRSGIDPKHILIIFKQEDDLADINDYLCELLPEFADSPSTCPWVVNHSSIGEATAASIRNRSGEISLYLSTAVMLMGIDCKEIDVVVMVRPFSMLHSMVQACGRGGRKMMDKFRRRVIFYLLFNNSDIGANIDVSEEVRTFCRTPECLKVILMNYFGTVGKTGGDWCCSNCDMK